jgi:hypothetical protein
MNNVVRIYQSCGCIHQDFLSLPAEKQKIILLWEQKALERGVVQPCNSEKVQAEIEIKLRTVQSILNNLW